MKACQIKIKLLKTKKKVTRTIIIPKQFTFDDLHKVIQVCFGLYDLELYEFSYNNKFLRRCTDSNKIDSANKKLIRVKEGEKFTYMYDLLDTSMFECHVEKIVDVKESYPILIDAKGENLMEAGMQSVTAPAQFNEQWVQDVLKGFSFSLDEQNELIMQIKASFEKLIKIKNWQDYIHGNIMKVNLEGQRDIYIGADASDNARLDFYPTKEALNRFMLRNNNAPLWNRFAYPSISSMLICKMRESKERDNFILSSGHYGCYVEYLTLNAEKQLPLGERTIFTKALARYVDCIQKMADEKMALEQKKLFIYKMDGTLETEELNFGYEDLMTVLKEEYVNEVKKMPKHQILEVDVVQVYEEETGFRDYLFLADELGVEGILLGSLSMKTIQFEFLRSIFQRFEIMGCYKEIWVRDYNMLGLLSIFADQCGIKLNMNSLLPQLDDFYQKNCLPDFVNEETDEVYEEKWNHDVGSLADLMSIEEEEKPKKIDYKKLS